MGKTIKGKPKGPGTKEEAGRPETELDMNTLIQCVKIQCTKEEAAAVCEVSADTVDRRLAAMEPPTTWTEFFTRHSSEGKASLRRAMFKSAVQDGNITAQIWLSKQHLGMKDRNEVGFDPDQPAVFVMKMGKDLTKGEDKDD